MIHVIILAKNKCHLRPLFDDEVYEVTVIHEKYVTENNTLLSLEEYNENLNYHKALVIARKLEKPCLIIKDTCITNLSAMEIKTFLLELITIDTDLCFLSTWQDECYKYKDYNDYFKWSTTCSCPQAVLYNTKNGKQSINQLKKISLTKSIRNADVKKLVCLPNLFIFDISRATSNNDYLKLNCCLPVPEQKSCTDNTNAAAWIIIIILFIVLLAVLVPYFKHNKHL